MEIVPGIHQIDGLVAANVFLIVDRDLTLVDTGTRAAGRRVLRYIQDLGHSPSEVRRILVTHHHFDHTGSLAFLAAATQAPCGAHPLDKAVIEGQTPPPAFRVKGPLRLLFALSSGLIRAAPAPVALALDDGQVLDVLGGLEVVHAPGHTPGSISLLLRSQGVLFVGDALANTRNNLSGPAERFTADMATALASVRKIAGLDFETCCFSHGPAIRYGAAKRVRELAARLAGPEQRAWIARP